MTNSIFNSRTYFITNERHSEFWLVDCGDVPPLINLLSSIGGKQFRINGVLLTHTHFDHIYGLPQITELFPKIKVITNAYGVKALSDEKLNYSRYHDNPFVYECDNVHVCVEGDIVELFNGVEAKIFETPGHCSSCLTFGIENYLFTGDAYIPGEKVVTMLPGADKVLAGQSLERILILAEGKVICPGHEKKR